MTNPIGVASNSVRKKTYSSPNTGPKFQARGERPANKTWGHKPKFRGEERSTGGYGGGGNENGGERSYKPNFEKREGSFGGSRNSRPGSSDRFAPKPYGDRRESSGPRFGGQRDNQRNDRGDSFNRAPREEGRSFDRGQRRDSRFNGGGTPPEFTPRFAQNNSSREGSSYGRPQRSYQDRPQRSDRYSDSKPRFEKGPKNFAKKFGKSFEKKAPEIMANAGTAPEALKDLFVEDDFVMPAEMPIDVPVGASEEMPAELIADLAAAAAEAEENAPAKKSFKPNKPAAKQAKKSFAKPAPAPVIAKIEIEDEFSDDLDESEEEIEMDLGETEEVSALPPMGDNGLFSDFVISEKIQDAIKDLGWASPTPIQAKSIPYSLKGQDIIGCAQTGTGKTAAFTIPMLNRLLENPTELSLILAPTRELAFQIRDTIKELLTHVPELRTALIIGGASYPEQVRSLAMGPRIVIATPGRLVDHLQNRTIRLSNVKFLVLDEADRMFDMGFAPQIDRIVSDIPKDRQTLLFSATFSKEVRALAKRTLKNPQEISIGVASSPAEGVEQEVIEVRPAEKFDMLMDQLNQREGSILLFIATKHTADRMAKKLNEFGHSVGRIHGGLTMGQRKSAISGFRDQSFRILVATDIAARGLDISHVAHVINFDLPRDPEDYIHRIGRTARAGAKGKALSLVNNQDKDAWRRISRLLPKNCVPKVITLAERQAQRDSQRQ